MRALPAAQHHLAAGMEAFEALGSILPAVWAHGPNGSVVASPYRQDAIAACDDGKAMTGIMVLLACATGCDVIGRTDEAWIRAVEPSELDQLPSSLEERSSWDPLVRTAVVAHAIEIDTARQAVMIGMEQRSDIGALSWQIETDEEPTGLRSEQMLYASAAVVACREILDTRMMIRMEDLPAYLDALGWLSADID